MHRRLAGVLLAAMALGSCSAGVQSTPAGYRAPRTPDGTPDLSGIWQANSTAYWDVEPHEARMGPLA
jgi:hypothetical protein